jgi:DnaJ-class molecular chaperone
MIDESKMVECIDCGGDGYYECINCRNLADPEEDCEECDGYGDVDCSICSGAGVVLHIPEDE